MSPAPTNTTNSANTEIHRLLERVDTVARALYHPGYDRECDPGACVFGPPWTDNHPGPFGHNGCDTRQDVLLQQMRDIELRWGSQCRIYQARLTDPYTGARLTWRADGAAIEIDHVYPLSRAWHGGAWEWSQRRRLRFANDVRRELLATSRQANQTKRDGSPAEWLPTRPDLACRYAVAYLRVALAYDLPITRADAEAVRGLACVPPG